MLSIKEKAENLVTYARNTNVNDLDKVVKAVVNLVQEQRLEVLEELITKLKLNNYETIVKKRQGQKVTEFSKRETI
jgi:hypothetical protein